MIDPQPYRPLSYLQCHAEGRPEATAVYDDGEEISFEDIFWRTQSLMASLIGEGVAPGDVVAVSLANTWQYVAAEIAIPGLGAIIMPLAPSLGAYEMESSLRRSGASLLLADREVQELVSTMRPGLPALGSLLQPTELELKRPQKPLDPYPTGPEEIVQIALTSGTTGQPKLACLSAELKQLTFEGYTGRLGITPEDRVLALSPISQGVGEMSLYALRVGACLVMVHERRFSPARDLRLVSEAEASVLSGVPTMISRLFHHPDFPSTDLSSLRVTAVAGAPMPPELAKAWEEATGSRVCGFYGAMDIGQLAVASPDDPPATRWESVGRPHDAAEFMVCDRLGNEVQQGEVGELCMRGPLVQQHYWGEESGPYADDGWAHFGDLGYVDELGFIHVVGRSKDTIIRGGDNINPVEVEAVLGRQPEITEACLVGLPDADLGERPVAFVVARPGCDPTLESVRGFLESEGLARYKWPEHLVVVPEMPLGSSGKVARSQLKQRAAAELASVLQKER
jgi:acyl-CoA synthetase (AMP-forming)/AMP-acid ligase II